MKMSLKQRLFIFLFYLLGYQLDLLTFHVLQYLYTLLSLIPRNISNFMIY